MQRKITLLLLVTALSACWPGGVHAEEKLCQLCHSSRFLKANNAPCSAWRNHSHPVGVVPPENMKVPKEFPLDKKGEITCSTCHKTLFDVERNPTEDIIAEYSSRIFLRTKNKNSSMCVGCHREQLETSLDSKTSSFKLIMDTDFTPQKQEKKRGAKISYNHPVGIQMKRRIPRVIYENGAKFGTQKETIICETCHKMHNASDKGLLILGNTESKLCGVCHPETYARNRREANRKRTHPVNIIPGRSIIPELVFLRGGTVGKKGKLQCRTCHRAHKAATKRTLLIKNNRKSAFCYECHPKLKENIEKTKHDLKILYPKTTNIKGESPEESGLCGVCHLAHRGTGSTMWARPVSQTEEPISDLCRTCHQKGKCGQKKSVGKWSHPVRVSIKSSHTATGSGKRLPLFSNEGARKNDGNVTCATCHNAHQWDQFNNDKGFEPLLDGNAGNSFLRVRNIKSGLCLTCHREKSSIKNTPHDPLLPPYKEALIPAFNVIKSSLPPKRNPGVCEQCHSAHNASGIFLWNRKTGQGPDKISRICSGCHQKSYIAQNKLTGKFTHPINKAIGSINRFLRIPLPLFDRNYRKDPEGVIMCSTCHDIHQWNPEDKDDKNQRFADGNGRNSFLRMSAVSDNRDLCSTCHLSQQWVKGTDHDLGVSAPGEKNRNRKTVDESGPCSACHSVHNSLSNFVLWGKPLGKGKDRISKICNGCHSDMKAAENKQTGRFSHPVAVSSFSVLQSLKETSLYIFDENYKRIPPEQEKIPLLFIKNKTSPKKIESIKKYYRRLFIRFLNLSKELPEINNRIQLINMRINRKVEEINRLNKKQTSMKKETEIAEGRYKRLEFNINVLEIKAKLKMQRKKSPSEEKKMRTRLALYKKAYREEEKKFKGLYRKRKKIKKTLRKQLDSLQKFKIKNMKLKNDYINRAEIFKKVRTKLQELIRKLRGRDKKLFSRLETSRKDA
ncbi:MAG: cytochrome c3 family protein, partial [bacterium]